MKGLKIITIFKIMYKDSKYNVIYEDVEGNWRNMLTGKRPDEEMMREYGMVSIVSCEKVEIVVKNDDNRYGVSRVVKPLF